MNPRVVLRVLGLLVFATGVAMLFPLLCAVIYHEAELRVFLLNGLLGVVVGGGLVLLGRGRHELGTRDGFLIVTFGWILVALMGALPFWLSGSIPSFSDAYFESMSGFTTTGASILTDIEAQSHSMLLWRSLIQWLGGMGIVVLSLAILPILGIGGMQLFKAEAPGPTPDRLTPRIKETAKLLWGVYVLISAAEVLALILSGLSPFDALCHTFTTMATGGFSTRDASVAALHNPAAEIIMIVFMFIAGANFSLHFAALRGRLKDYFRDDEFRTYLVVILVAATTIFLSNLRLTDFSIGRNLRGSFFQVVSIMTTTGFCTDDYARWGSMPQYLLLLLMFIGGCAGSTGGGMKNARFLIFMRHASNELRKLLHPRAVYTIRFNKSAVPPDIVTNIMGFILLMMIITTLATFCMTLVGLDLVSAFGSVAATLNNIGPGVGSVGPTNNFAHVHVVGKWVLTFCMLVGRLELYTVLVLFAPEFWRKH
ncbi:MAG TPA: potassium transporter TrkG [Candidatus Krumholzibacteria bacterium]|nr:potassium transporter TrkG [Candidatus Krumholzibacteria bacterium]